MRVFENRASTVLCNFLKSNHFDKPFLLPANVCPVVPLSFMKAEVEFDFIDIDKTHAMNMRECLRRIKNGSYSGVLFVNAYGKAFNNEQFYAELKSVDSAFCIIDDKCLCIPDLREDLAPYVDLELYSTGYAKYVELSYGGWGIINERFQYKHYDWEYDKDFQNEQDIYLKECLLSDKKYSWENVPWLDPSPLNEDAYTYLSKIDNLIQDTIAHKEIINNIYYEYLPTELQWDLDYANWRFMIEVDNRDYVINKIFDENLFVGKNFPSVSMLFKGVHMREAEQESNRIINLFNDFRVDEDFAYRICSIINLAIR